jgi:hypothetical protein
VYTRPNAPRSIGGVLDDGLRLWLQAFSKTWPLALISQVLLMLPLVIYWLQSGSIATIAQSQFFPIMMKSAGFSLSYALASFASIGFQNAIVAQTDAAAWGRALSTGQGLSVGFRLFGRTLWFGILVAIAIAVPLALVFFALAGVSTLGRIAFGIAVFLVICFVLGKILLGATILVVEDKGAVESLRRSWTLTTGHWWRVAAILTVLIIVIAVVLLVIGVLAGIVAAMAGRQSITSALLVQLLSLFGNTLLGPLFSAVSVAILYDLKLRKEGADLAGRVSALAPQ